MVRAKIDHEPIGFESQVHPFEVRRAAHEAMGAVSSNDIAGREPPHTGCRGVCVAILARACLNRQFGTVALILVSGGLPTTVDLDCRECCDTRVQQPLQVRLIHEATSGPAGNPLRGMFEIVKRLIARIEPDVLTAGRHHQLREFPGHSYALQDAHGFVVDHTGSWQRIRR